MTTSNKESITRGMKGYMRDEKGKYTKIPFLHSNFAGVKLLLGITLFGAMLNYLYTPVELVSPISSLPVVHAVEPTPQPTTEPRSEKEQILSHIIEVFGDEADKMITIIGTCENGTWDQSRTNTNRNGTKDWGIAQINDANEKLCKGLDFRYSWKENIDCAKRVRDSQGFSAWACSHKVGIKPFYMKGTK